MSKHSLLSAAVALLFLSLIAGGCASSSKDEAMSKSEADMVAAKEEFEPFVITDSSQIKTLPNGLKIYHVRRGPGEYPGDGQRLRIHYHGLLENGTSFDSSFDRDEPLEFILGRRQLIAGMEEGIKRMRMGSRAILIIPPELGYGNEANGNIPANSTLIFHVELLGAF